MAGGWRPALAAATLGAWLLLTARPLAAAIGDFQVNAVTTGNQNQPSIAADLAGNFVVVWQDDRFGSADLFARRFSSSGFGTPLGVIFRVNSATTGQQEMPKVARDSTGAFVVTWRDDKPASLRAVLAQRFDSSGSPAGPEFRVNTFTTTGSHTYPRVAAAPAGAFAIVWQSEQTTDTSAGIFLRRFSATGEPQGAELRVNTVTSSLQETPAAAFHSTGDFVVVWNSRLAGQGIRGQRFLASGARSGAEFAVGGTSGVSSKPAVATDLAGGFAVTWENHDGDFDRDVFVRRFASSGAPLAPEARVNTFTSNLQFEPSLAIFPSGDFAVTWTSLPSQDGAGQAVVAQQFHANGSPSGAEFIVNAYTNYDQNAPAIAPGAGGGFLVVWTSHSQDAPLSAGVFGRQEFPGTPVDLEDFRVNTYTTQDQQGGSIAMDPQGSFVVVWQTALEDGSNLGVYMQPFDDSGAPIGPELRVNTVTAGSQFVPSAAILPAGGFVVAWTDITATNSDLFLRRFTDGAQPVGAELRVNTVTSGSQGSASVASGPGGFVVAWNEFTLSGEPRARLFSPEGTPLGPEFRVNTITSEQQDEPRAAMSDSGAFVVIWNRRNQDIQFGGDVILQRFNAAGVPLGGELQVNIATTGSQSGGRIGMDSAGRFVVVWSSYQGGLGSEIFARRFTADGAPLAGEFRVNSYTTNDQTAPVAAMEAGGGFVVAWRTFQEGGTNSVIAQRFARAGSPVGGPFRVNTYTTSPITAPNSLAFDGDGRFVVIFETYGGDGSRFGVFRRRFAALVVGDADGNGAAGVSDILYLINFLFTGGPAPLGEADANADGAVNVGDILYLINFLFAGGPPPA